MKQPIIWGLLLAGLSLGSCFEDEGNYDYQTLDAPVWKINDNELIRISCRAGAGEEVYFNGGDYYTWATDSLARAAEVRYEWKVNGVVFATEPSVKMPTDEFIKAANITEFGASGIPGSFAIIEKATGVVYMASVNITIAKTHDIGDWMVLSEKPGGASKLSFVKRRLVTEGETRKLLYELKDDYYYNVNGEDIPGAPRSLAYSYGAQNVSSLGSLTVLTGTGAYEVNPETYIKVQDIKDDFTGNTPDNLSIVDRQDAWGGPDATGGLHSFIATEDGRVYTKMMTKNNLGGNFMSTPYEVDAKGYKITAFGSTQVGYTCIPCYDEKNRRMMAILFQQSGQVEGDPMWGEFPVGPQFMISKMYPIRQPEFAPVANVPDVENMPADTEILQLGIGGSEFVGFFTGVMYYYIGMVYNTGGKTYLGEYAIVGDKSNPGLLGNVNMLVPTNREFPGGNLDKSSVILFASYMGSTSYPKNVNNYILYSKGHEVFCLDRGEDYAQQFKITLEDSSDKITCMKWGIWNDYDELLIGTEKGKVYCYNRLSTLKPQLLTTMDVQGKVRDLKELFNWSYGSGRDNY